MKNKHIICSYNGQILKKRVNINMVYIFECNKFFQDQNFNAIEANDNDVLILTIILLLMYLHNFILRPPIPGWPPSTH